MHNDEARQLVATIQATQTETDRIEVKAANGGTPTRALREALSAMANQSDGGVIVLGLDETRRFTVVGVHNLNRTLTDISNIAANELTPPLRPVTTHFEIDGKPVVIIEVPELHYPSRPCFITAAGIQAGSYVRVGPSNRQMTTYEVFTLLSFREHRLFDNETVPNSTIEELDPLRVDTYRLASQSRSKRSNANLPRTQALQRLGIVGDDNGILRPTLAGLLCFADYPQQFLPQLRIVFTHFYGETEAIKSPDGARYLDDREFDGPVDEMIESSLAAVMHTLPSALYVPGVRNVRVPLFPRDAIREGIVNAVAHRDYSGYMRGSSIQIRLFSDRLEVRSPGGLYGGLRVGTLHDEQSTRNPLLMRFLEDMNIVENRGSGIDVMCELMAEAGLPKPEFKSTGSWFQVTFRKVREQPGRHVASPLSNYRIEPIRPDEHVLGLIDQTGHVTNADVRDALGLERWQAMRLLQRMAANGQIVKHGDRRTVHYTRP